MPEAEESGFPGRGAPQQGCKKPAATRIVLSGSNKNKTIVLAKPSTMVGKLLAKYCEQRSISPGEYRLVYKGERMNEGETVGSYNIRDNDTIDVVTQQVGGARLCCFFD